MMFSNLFPEKIDVTERIDSIENAVYKQLKEFGFKSMAERFTDLFLKIYLR